MVPLSLKLRPRLAMSIKVNGFGGKLAKGFKQGN
jgi:hypothetical protein